jgi:hypothetical protein
MSDLVGTTVDVVELEVERGKVLEMVRATHALDPAHTERGLATATHVVVAGHHRDQRGVVEGLGLELARIVVGSVGWTYARPLVVGDHLVGTRTVVADDTREGSGGTLRLVTLETAWTDPRGQVVVTQREVLVERPAR